MITLRSTRSVLLGSLSAMLAWLLLYDFGLLVGHPVLPLGLGLPIMVVAFDLARDREYPIGFRACLYGMSAGCLYAAVGSLVVWMS